MEVYYAFGIVDEILKLADPQLNTYTKSFLHVSIVAKCKLACQE